MTEFEEENIISVSRRPASLEYEEDKEFRVASLHQIIKTIAHKGRIYNLDLAGNASIIETDEQKVKQTVQHCTDIFVTD